MIVRPVLSAFARHRKVRAAFYLGNVIIFEEGPSSGRLASASRFLSQSSCARQQKTPLSGASEPNGNESDISSSADNDQLPVASEPSLTRSMQLLNENLVRKEYSRAEGRRRVFRSPRSTSPNDMASWKRHMSESLDRQGDRQASTSEERQAYYRHREIHKQQEVARKAERAKVMARTMVSSRSQQPDASPPDDGPRMLITRPIFPGGGGNTTGNLPLLHFEQSFLRYPPKDVYPPPLPMVREIDLLTAARALGVLRSCEVDWDATQKVWRKTSRSNDYYEQQGLYDFLDTEQALEYVGDTVMHTISKSLIMSQFPYKSVAVYNVASAWLVSNECFSYMFEDSGLEEERLNVARFLMAYNKKRELEKLPESFTSEERMFCAEANLPDPNIPVISHRRKADLLEAYVGAVFDLYGFQTASKWCTMLLEPWLDMIDRTTEFHADRFLSPSGEARKRAAILLQKREEDEKRRTGTWWGKMRAKFFAK